MDTELADVQSCDHSMMQAVMMVVALTALVYLFGMYIFREILSLRNHKMKNRLFTFATIGAVPFGLCVFFIAPVIVVIRDIEGWVYHKTSWLFAQSCIAEAEFFPFKHLFWSGLIAIVVGQLYLVLFAVWLARSYRKQNRTDDYAEDLLASAVYAWVLGLEIIQFVTSGSSVLLLYYSPHCCEDTFLLGYYMLNTTRCLLPISYSVYHRLKDIPYWITFSSLILFVITVYYTAPFVGVLIATFLLLADSLDKYQFRCGYNTCKTMCSSCGKIEES